MSPEELLEGERESEARRLAGSLKAAGIDESLFSASGREALDDLCALAEALDLENRVSGMAMPLIRIDLTQTEAECINARLMPSEDT